MEPNPQTPTPLDEVTPEVTPEAPLEEAVTPKEEAAAPASVKGKRSRRGEVKPQNMASSLQISSISPWSLAYNGLYMGVINALIFMAFVAGVWYTFDWLGIFEKVVSMIAPEGEGADKLLAWLTLEKFLMVGGALSLVIAVATPVAAFFLACVYNLVARLTGGARMVLGHKARS